MAAKRVFGEQANRRAVSRPADAAPRVASILRLHGKQRGALPLAVAVNHLDKAGLHSESPQLAAKIAAGRRVQGSALTKTDAKQIVQRLRDMAL